MHPDCFVIEEVLSPTLLRGRRRDAEGVRIREPRPAWKRLAEPPLEARSVSYRHSYDDEDFEEVEPRSQRRQIPPPPWAIGFSKQFHKDTKGMDGKLLGRVLRALEELSQSTRPLRPQGDTFKPLEGKLKGCWRYRIGDHRLVVQPRVEDGRIDALTLAARGSVYD